MNTGTSRGSITYRSSATSTNGLRRSFGPDGCQAVVDGAKCGETKNLQIIAEFKRMYEDKMKQIDDIAGGDCIQAKVNLQQEWIKDLTDQNEMLVKVVEELEVEAAERVTMLEKKLQQTAKSAGDVMESYRDFSINFLGDLQKMERVQNDMNNLLELIRRAQADGVWNADGLQFYCLDIDDVIGSSCSGILVATNDSVKQKEDMLKEKERRIKELENQLKPYVESGKSPQDYNTIKKDYKELEQSMLDMRDALTAEVADKHDTVLCLRREVHLLEEQCRKADQQTHFKDDIIKELRKEIKQLKQQQEAGDCLQVALPVDFVSQEVPVHHRTFGSRSLPLRIERTDKEVQTANGSVNTPNWMGIVNDIIERTEHEKTLIVALETECRNLVKQLGNKDKYIFDQNDLIVLLVQKLYIVYRTLRDLEEKTNVMAPNGKVQKLKDALTDAKEQLASAKELADSCGKERDDLKKKLDTAQEQLDFQNVEIAGLKDQLAACLEETEKIKGQNSQETDKLKGMLADKTAEHNALKEQKEQESKDLQDKLDAHKQEMETLKKNHEQASKDLQDKLDAHRDELDTLKKDHATAKEDLHKQLGSTKEEMDDLKNQHAAKQNELLDKHAAEVETLKNEKLKELENFENQHKQTLAQLEQLRVELEKTKMEHKVCMDKIKDLGEENTLLKEKTERKKNVSSAQMSPEIDAKEKIAKLEEQLRAALKQKEQAVEYERNRRNQEVENLKLTIQHMENVIKNKQANSENLQCAVDLYSDSITILEESKQHYETEIAQQQVTIANLQDALVITKRDLEELQLKFKQDQDHKCELLNILDIGVRDLEATCLHYYDQLTSLSKTVKRLRDENLSLEVAKSELIQDTGMLESRLLKYQQEERLISEFVLGLKEEINRLKYENHADSMKMVGLKNDIGFYIDQAAEIKNIMQHILGVGDCENPICNPDGATEDLVLTAQEVERFVQSLQGQVNLMLASLEREQKMNQVNTARIDELQNILGIKNMELNRSIEMYQDLKVKLESCAVRNKKLEEAVVELQEQLADTELDQQFQEQKVDLCHGELDICLNNLNCIKMKLRQQCQTMTQKIDELTELKSDFNSQNTDLEMYKRDLECTRVMHRDEVLELKRVIRELTDKLQGSQVKVEELTDELNNVQEIIVNMTQRESKLQQELSVKDQDFGNKLQVWKVKEARLLEQISQLEQQLRAVHNELAGRTHQIDSAKCKLQQISNDAHMRVQMGQEELLAAKDEINALRQVHEKLQVENDALQQTVHSLQATLAHHESVNATVKKQLDKCMCDLKKIETDKYFVEQKNEKLMQELDKMQATLRSRCENMLCLEEELNEMKNDREEIRKESHHVVCNVRAWLEEQKKVNDQLKDKLLKKNALIIKYQQASTSNMDVIGPPNPNIKKTLPPVCAEVCNRRQRGGTVSSRVFNTCNNIKRGSTGLWSLNSRGSDTDSPRSSICSDSADWCDVDASEATTAPCDEPGTQIWIQRVESMTEKLERTNRYWKRKISDSEFMVTRDK